MRPMSIASLKALHQLLLLVLVATVIIMWWRLPSARRFTSLVLDSGKLACQSVSQSVSQLVSQSVGQSVSQSVSQ